MGVTELPDLDSLQLLVSVAHHGSIGGAARAHGITQQSASERLRTLESEIGLAVLQRSPTGSSLTPSGRLLVEWSTALLARADEVAASLRTLREDRSRDLHVHASMTTAEHLVPRWLVRLRQEIAVAATMIASNTTAVLEAVRSGEADVGIIEGPGDLTGLASRVVGGDSLRLVAHPDDPWARRRTPLSASTISARALTSREPGSGTRQVAEDAFRAAGHPLAPPEAELTTNAAVLATVRAGGPPALVSDLTLTGVEDLAIVATTGVDLTRSFRAVWAGSSRPPAGPLRDLLAIAARASAAPSTRGVRASSGSARSGGSRR